MKTALQAIIETEKEKLKLKYQTPTGVRGFFNDIIYKSTNEIANTPPYIQDEFEEFKAFYRKYSSLLSLLPLSVFVYFFFFN